MSFPPGHRIRKGSTRRIHAAWKNKLRSDHNIKRKKTKKKNCILMHITRIRTQSNKVPRIPLAPLRLHSSTKYLVNWQPLRSPCILVVSLLITIVTVNKHPSTSTRTKLTKRTAAKDYKDKKIKSKLLKVK